MKQADPRLVSRFKGGGQMAERQVGVPVITDIQLLAHQAAVLMTAKEGLGVADAVSAAEEIVDEIFERQKAHRLNHLPVPSRQTVELSPTDCFYCRAIVRDQDMQERLNPRVVAPTAGPIVSPVQ